jgi:CRP-like cAMP-binding protein
MFLYFDGSLGLPSQPVSGQTVHLERGDHALREGTVATPTMLISGALRVDQSDACGQRPVMLALPGDLIGLEGQQGRSAGYSASAIVSSVVLPLPTSLSAEVWRNVLMHSLIAQRERAAEVADLRCGSAPERIRKLLLLLSSQSRGGAGVSPWQSNAPSCEQPTLVDMAALTDTSIETISRVISAMRRAGDLVRDQGRRVRLDARVLDRDWALCAAATYRPQVRQGGRAQHVAA